jgi:hypothetical protein
VVERISRRLSEGLPGLLGAVTARSEAQCVRLALLFALLDGAGAINEQHLLAALAVWERAAASARFIFGSAVGDPVADEILRALRTAGAVGVTRTGIRDLFRRHQSAERIGMALDLLLRRKLASSERQPTGGAPVEIWRALERDKSDMREAPLHAPLMSLISLMSQIREGETWAR